MEDANVTAAVVISFSETLEDSSSEFYQELANRWPKHEGQFLAFARDCERSKANVIRTYQETISDALDAGYSFKGLQLEEFRPDTALPIDVSYADALTMALALEGTAIAFYQTVAEQASLLATIPRAFRGTAKRRSRRKKELEALLAEVT